MRGLESESRRRGGAERGTPTAWYPGARAGEGLGAVPVHRACAALGVLHAAQCRQRQRPRRGAAPCGGCARGTGPPLPCPRAPCWPPGRTWRGRGRRCALRGGDGQQGGKARGAGGAGWQGHGGIHEAKVPGHTRGRRISSSPPAQAQDNARPAQQAPPRLCLCRGAECAGGRAAALPVGTGMHADSSRFFTGKFTMVGFFSMKNCRGRAGGRGVSGLAAGLSHTGNLPPRGHACPLSATACATVHGSRPSTLMLPLNTPPARHAGMS